MCDDSGNIFIATLHNVLLAPDLCNRLFSIITLMNAGHTCLFNKGFCTVYFGAGKKNAVTVPHSSQKKHAFLGKIKDMSKKKLPAIFFLAGNLFFFYISLIFPRNACFFCVLCGNVTAFFFSATKYTVQNLL